MDEKKIPILVLMDMSKAFDSINLNMLLKVFKLRSLGMSPSASEWFKSYLKGRYQYVSIGDVVLQSLPVDYIWSSTGSILGPVLFTFYINDLLNHSPLSRP